MKTAWTAGGNRNRAQIVTGHLPESALPSEMVDQWNVETFEESLGRCEARAYRLALHLVHNEPAAQEILQETFLSAWQNTRLFATRAQFDAWVYRATVKAALGRQSSAHRQEPPCGDSYLLSSMKVRKYWGRTRADEDSNWFSRAPEELRSEGLHRHVRRTIDSLSAVLRTVFILCDLEGMSVADTAEILGLSVVVAREDLQAARLLIRSAIGTYFAGSEPGVAAAPPA